MFLFIAGVEIADGENDRYMPEEEEGLKFRNDRNTYSTGKKEVNNGLEAKISHTTRKGKGTFFMLII